VSKELDELNAKLGKDLELHKRKEVLSEKEITLREHKVEIDLNNLIKNTSEIEIAKTIGFGKLTAGEIEQLVRENEDYMLAAKHSMNFINKEFAGTVPYFRKNLIVVLADTGHGKSTAVANIVYETISRINPATGKMGRVLVITNEEASEDFYNRITCFIKGWNYTKHNEFSDIQRKIFNEYIPILAKGGRLTVIGDTYQGISGWTRTIEGIKTILDSLIRDEVWYDAIIIDYYQNVTRSKLDSRLDINKCQEKFADMLDEFKTSYPAPIVVFAQINKRRDEEDTTPFNVRIKGRKIICDKATFIMELIPVHELRYSRWLVHKTRFTGTINKEVETGFDKGKFVPYSVDFKKNVATMREKELTEDAEKILGVAEKAEVKIVEENKGDTDESSNS
jgi:hypothetical protein